MKRIGRSIVCEICGQSRRTWRPYDICRTCVSRLPKLVCAGCKRFRYRLADHSIHCTGCVELLADVRIACKRCGADDYPFKRDLLRCRKCYKSRTNYQGLRRSLAKKIVCVECGQTRAACKTTEDICRACYDKRLRGGKVCLSDGCDRLIASKATLLCGRHHGEHRSRSELRKYLQSYRSPFPQNERYMFELSAMIDWNCGKPLGSETLFRFRAIGKFLTLNELPKILSWQAIEAALPPLTGKRRTAKQIRSSLMDLGHLYAVRGELPDWNSYLSHRRIKRKTELLPARYCENVRSFKAWLENGMLNPNLILCPASVQILSNSSQTIGDIIRTIVHFLSWCAAGGIGDISAVDENVIIDYQWELLWEYECRMCKKRIPFKIDVIHFF